MFCHVERSLSGVILDSARTAQEAIQRTRTQTGITVTARILDTVYELGRKCSETFRDIRDKFIRHDNVLGEWEYVVYANGFAVADTFKVVAGPVVGLNPLFDPLSPTSLSAGEGA